MIWANKAQLGVGLRLGSNLFDRTCAGDVGQQKYKSVTATAKLLAAEVGVVWIRLAWSH